MSSLKSRLSQALPHKFLDSLRNPALEKKSVHEEKLRDYFKAFNVPESTQSVDRPLCIMLFTNRSGSNAIGEYLRATNRFSGFTEMLNYRLIVKLSDQKKFSEFGNYLDWQVSRNSSEGTVVGMKASSDQALMLYRCGAIPNLLKNVHWILVQRNDVLGQAISFSIAAQTMQWTSEEKAGGDHAKYAFDDIKHRVTTLTNSYAQMNAFCALFGIEPYRIAYEDFLADPKLCARGAAADMGMDQVEFDETLLTMQIQRDDRNQEFKERFIADYQREQRARR